MVIPKEKQIISAVQAGDALKVKQLIATTYDLNFIDDSDTFPLLAAVYADDVELINLIIGHGADINLKNHQGMTALMAAAHKGHKSTVEFLLQQKADPSLKNSKKYTALHFAVDRGNLEIIDLLLNHTDPDAYTGKDSASLFIPAIENKKTDIVAYLLSKNIPFEPMTDKEIPPLTMAAISPSPEIVKLLLEKGANVRAKDGNGIDSLWTIGTMDRTFLIEKIYSLSYPEFFKSDLTNQAQAKPQKTKIGFKTLLKSMERIADSNGDKNRIKQLEENYDFSFLFSDIPQEKIQSLADGLKQDYVDITKQLQNAGADVNTTDKRNRSILNMICGQKKQSFDLLLSGEIIQIDDRTRDRMDLVIACADSIHNALAQTFIEKTDINLPDEYGNTPLLLSCAPDTPDLAQILIQHGADINISNKDGWTPLITAVSAKKYNVANLLLENGANVNRANKFGETAMLKAVYNNDEEMVKLLLNSGADFRLANKLGDSPVSVAKRKGYDNILKLFSR